MKGVICSAAGTLRKPEQWSGMNTSFYFLVERRKGNYNTNLFWYVVVAVLSADGNTGLQIDMQQQRGMVLRLLIPSMMCAPSSFLYSLEFLDNRWTKSELS